MGEPEVEVRLFDATVLHSPALSVSALQFLHSELSIKIAESIAEKQKFMFHLKDILS